MTTSLKQCCIKLPQTIRSQLSVPTCRRYAYNNLHTVFHTQKIRQRYCILKTNESCYTQQKNERDEFFSVCCLVLTKADEI